MQTGTVGDLVARLDTEEPERPVLLRADGSATSRADLAVVVTAWAARIEQLGLGGADRIVVSLPNGVPMATTFVGVAANAICAPLNPKYTEPEAEFYLTDLDAGLVVVDGDTAPGVRAAAEAAGIPILDLATSLAFDPGIPSASPTTVRRPDDIALILHTSGTTSRPKQVPLTHTNLLTSARNVSETLGLGAGDRCANVMPLFHIHGLVACLLASLHAGASVVCTEGFDPRTFLATVAGERCTWYSAVPTIHQAVLSAATANPDDAANSTLRFIRSSSSSLPPSVMDRLEAQFGVPVIEAYGMTEAAHQMTSNRLPPGNRRSGAVGEAAGPEVSVVDAGGTHLPTGSIGELVIRGDNVMSGYLTPVEANDDAFFDGWFRTGDQGTIDEAGVVTITGRLKELINRAGEKIAPREIDEALLADPDIAEALAFALPHPTLGEDVAAVVIPVDPAGFDDHGVLDRLRERLAEHKIPRRLVVVDELPKGATGKPARIGLAERLGLVDTTPTAGSAVAGDPLVAAAAAVISAVLTVPAVGPDDDFVVAGGDSLHALAAAIAVEDVFGVAIPAGMLLGPAATARTLAEAIRAERRNGPAIEAADSELTSAARRLWTQQQIDPQSAAYNVGLALRLRGPLGTGAIDHAVARLAFHHPALRTTISNVEGELETETITTPPPADVVDIAPDETAGFVSELLGRPVDLASEPLRVAIGSVAADDHVLVLVTHHALVDGPSRQVLRRDLGLLLDGRELDPIDQRPPRPVRRRGESIEFWRGELEDLPPAPILPAPRSVAPGVGRSEASLSGPSLERLRALARSHGATMFAVMLAAHAEALRRVGAQDDLIVAIPVTTRPPADGTTVGMFIETVPVRLRLAGVDSVERLIAEVRRALTDALAHGDVPFDELVTIASLERASNARPLAGTMCQLRPPEPDAAAPAGISIEDVDAPTAEARFDLTVDFIDRGDHLAVVVEHDRAVLDDAHGLRHAERILRTLDGLATSQALDEFDICSAAERVPLGTASPAEPDAASEPLRLVEAIDDLAAADPDAVSVIDGERTITRAELVARSRAFAAAFDEKGAGPSRPVAIALPRGADAIAAMIGAWRVGAPYVALDHAGPSERDRAVLERTKAATVAARAGDWGAPLIDPSDIPEDCTQRTPRREGPLAWILATSGSTGEPKLVPGSMAGLVNRLQWGRQVIPVTGPAAHRAPLVFVDHVAEVFEPLLAGQPLVVFDDDTVRDPRRMAARIEAHGVARLLVVPMILRMLVAGLPDGGALASLETVVTSGEPLPRDVADDWRRLAPQARLINIYGSTEVSADATAAEIEPDMPISVGTPIGDCRIQVLSASGPPSPPGCVGQIWVSGVGVMSGYVDDDTDDSIVDADVDGEERAWFRTGDRGYQDAQGRLFVVGRSDRQLKVRGVRIDPTEVEAALRSRPGVDDAAVFVRDGALDAALVSASGADVDVASVREALTDDLPASHVPSRIQILAELPRTSTGKLDRAALEAWIAPVEVPARPPESETERWLEEQWRTLIPGMGSLRVDDDFFSVGGHSLPAVELFARIEHDLGLDLPVSAIFDAPTIKTLARMIDSARSATPGSSPPRHIVEILPGAPGSPTLLWCSPRYAVALHEFRGHLGTDIRLVALEAGDLHRGEFRQRRVELIAAEHARALQSMELTGPVVVGGNSLGGIIAYELARLLRQEGVDLDLLVVVDSWPPGARPEDVVRSLPPRRRFAQTTGGTLAAAIRFVRRPRNPWTTIARYRQAVREDKASHVAAKGITNRETLDTETIVFATAARRRKSGHQDLGWQRLIRDPVEVVELEGSHGGLLRGARGELVGRELVDRLGAERRVVGAPPTRPEGDAATAPATGSGRFLAGSDAPAGSR